MTIDPNEPAFPMPSGLEPRVNSVTHYNEGMSIRLYIATEAMKAIIAKIPLFAQNTGNADALEAVKSTASLKAEVMVEVVCGAFQYADCMILRANQEPTK